MTSALPPHIGGDPIAAVPLPHPPRAVAFARLELFGTSKGPMAPNEVPWPLAREHVVEFIVERVQARALGVGAASRLEIVTGAYLLRELADAAAPCFESPIEGDDDVARLAYLCAAIAVPLGGPELTSLASRYQALLQHRAASGAVRALLRAREALGPAARSEALERLATNRVLALAQSGDPDSELEARDLDDDAANALQEVEWANQARLRFTALSDDAARVAFLLDVYLERSDFGGERILLPWSVVELRKHAHRLGRAAVVEALQAELERTRATRAVDPDARFAAIRVLRAIDFFGGVSMAPADTALLRRHGDEQVDLLSREQLLPHMDLEWMGIRM